MDVQGLVAIGSAATAIVSATIAWLAIRRDNSASTAETFLQIAQTFEAPDMRQFRRAIYRLDRDGWQNWDADTCAAVDTWIGFLDLVGTLMRTRYIRGDAYLRMYGDVSLRTIFQVAAYCNAETLTRGAQFQIPMRHLTRELHALWTQEHTAGRYPFEIGFPSKPGVRLTPDSFREDEDIRRFAWDGYS